VAVLAFVLSFVSGGMLEKQWQSELHVPEYFMSDVTARVVWTGGARFTGVDSRGNETLFDGDHESAPSPVDLLLESIASCTAVDVVAILEKVRTPAKRLEVTVEADRHSPAPRYLVRTSINFDIWGDDIKPEKAARALHLSVVKYCTVFNSLRTDMKATAAFRIHKTGTDPSGEYIDVPLTPL
jgi:putative redox protein